MRFDFEYRTADNVVRRGCIDARDREAAYGSLRRKGIRPSRLAEAPGFFNKFLGKGKRWAAITVLGAVVVVLSGRMFWGDRGAKAADDLDAATPRHQIYGDPSIVAEMTDGAFASVFGNVGERFLAFYAQPGSEISLHEVLSQLHVSRGQLERELAGALTNVVSVADDEPREVRELRRIVKGLKDELRVYLSDGVGTPSSYLRRLEERRHEELMIYERVANEVENDGSREVLEERNAQLRSLGLRTLSLRKKSDKKIRGGLSPEKRNMRLDQ